MLNEPTLEKLHSMKLFGMAEGFRTQLETAAPSGLSFEERFALLVDEQWTWRENRALARRLRVAKLKERGVIEDIKYQHPRQLEYADTCPWDQRRCTNRRRRVPRISGHTRR